MKTIKVAKATDIQLDWLVAKCEGLEPFLNTPHDGNAYTHGGRKFLQRYSALWAQAGPIIEREGINTFKHNKLNAGEPDKWCGHKVGPRPNMEGSTNMVAIATEGPTMLIAGLRCYVASRLGEEVEVPEELA